MITNSEIKAKSHQNDKIREILLSKDARYIGKDHQIDTYFNFNYGKLKLRRGNIENALIHYQRENIAEAKKSEVNLVKFDPDSRLWVLEERLKEAFGVLVVVNKKREIYFIKNVKFHLDVVKDLGSFVEIEAIDSEGKFSLEDLAKQCNFYKNLFGIKDEDLIKGSYSDMLLELKDE
ncbi:MAG: CYTH domain-containing protein [Nanoarchaeota archaeon]